MKAKTVYSGLAITALLITGWVSTGHADTWNKKTIVSFPESVELPGNVVVPAGTYVFKLADSSSNRHIVQVMSEAEDKVHATILAIPAQRQEPAEDTILTFYETPKDQPMFIQKWFYPGQTIGHEFAYPKERAGYIARTANTNVLLAPGEDNGEIGAYMTPDSREIARMEVEGEIAHSADRAADKTEDAVNKAATATEQTAENAVDEADQAAEQTEGALSRAASATKDAAETAVDKTGEAIDEAADATGRAAAGAANAVDRTADAIADNDDEPDAAATNGVAADAVADDSQADPVAQQPADPARTNGAANARAAADQEQGTLPQTAGWTPMIGLAGLALLGAASALRFRR